LESGGPKYKSIQQILTRLESNWRKDLSSSLIESLEHTYQVAKKISETAKDTEDNARMNVIKSLEEGPEYVLQIKKCSTIMKQLY
jgi:hypothetical protein